jgi:hypothetical protein
MALQSSGTIGISNLRSEYGDTGSSSLSEFYRGGSRVVSSVTVSVATPYSYYTTSYENQTTYTTQAQTSYSNVSEYGFDNFSGAQTFWYGNAGRGTWWILWAGTYKRYLPHYFTSYAHADGWTYSLGGVYGSYPTTAYGGSTTIIGTVTRSKQVATTTYVQVPTTVSVAVQNGPYTGYNYSNQSENRNTSVPGSGSVSLSQFYGGHN